MSNLILCPLCSNRMRDDKEDGVKCKTCGICGTKLFLGEDLCGTPKSSTKD